MKLKKSTHCLNCNEDINNSNYCPNCGQMNTQKKLPIKHFLRDFIGDYFTFDSKFFKSIIPLLIKPGHLTREYLDGRRVSYIFPLRLYIFTTFVFFFVITLNTKLDYAKFSNNMSDSTKTETALADSINKSASGLEDKISSELKKGITYKLDTAANSGKNIDVEGPGFSFNFTNSEKNNNEFLSYLDNKSKYLAGLGNEGSALFWKEIINQFPKLMFLLLPIFALILKLLYIRNNILYVEHLVFALHIHTFAFILLFITIFFANVYVISVILLCIIIYLFLSILNFYGQSVGKSSIKFCLLIVLYTFALLPSFGLLIFLAFLSI